MSITYEKFLELLREGENYRVDFKIRCDAFASPSLAPKAELLKDICAFSNNGNVTSYLIIGVSDDRNIFESVRNPNLNDENIQDYCRKNLYPPPKLRIFRKRWNVGQKDIIGKDILFIQIGPHKRQAFCFAGDIIDNTNKIYYRRNEVWIRRGTISDTATPEEVARLVAGQSPLESQENPTLVTERYEFAKLPQSERKRMVVVTAQKEVISHKYILLPKNEWSKIFLGYGGSIQIETYLKKETSTILLLDIVSFDKLIKSDFTNYWQLIEHRHNINNYLKGRFSRTWGKIFRLRRISIFSVLLGVPRRRVHANLPTWEWTGNSLYFFDPNYNKVRGHYKGSSNIHDHIAQSSELVIIDNILSISDFQERLNEMILFIESFSKALVQPDNDS